MEIAGLSTAITQETANMDDPRQHIAWALGSFPSPNQDMGEVPVHPGVRPLLSELLVSLGFRHDPTLQRKWLIPGDHPEAGWLNVPKVVDRVEYDEWKTANADPEAAEKWRATAEKLLGELDPKMAQRISEMTPEERAAAAAVQRETLPAAFSRLAELAEQHGAEEPS
ncbi:hypothetical protein ACFWPK_22435 [Nocardia sp. NPDC058519]|uniref:phage gene 29 protein family protein n=1 Tax=Nocardia sp. NPDC058519 TaxID=3346535 RepID=UPI00365CC44F